MTETTKKKSPLNGKSTYWGITENSAVIFEGSFEQCWSELHKRYPNATMTTFHEQGIKISRTK